MLVVDQSVDFAHFKDTPSFDSQVSILMRIGYERLSKDKAGLRINVKIQRDEIDNYAEETGEPVGRHFSDNDKSASYYGTKERDGYEDMLLFIKTGVVYEIIVTEVSRLSRQSDQGLELVKLRHTTPLRYISTTDGARYDITTARGRKAFRDAISDAEFESDQNSARQGRKKNKQAEAGMFHGGQRPYGYEGAVYEEFTTEDGEKVKGRILNPTRVGRAIVETEAKVRIEWTNRIIAGEREVDLVRDFNRRGIPAPNGDKWRLGNTRRILTSERAVAFDNFPGKGTRTYKGKKYRAVWDAVISREDYELMMAALRSRKTNRRGGMVNGRQYLLSNITRCGRCGGTMYGTGRNLASGRYQRRYVCRKFDSHGNPIGCGNVYRSADPVDRLVVEAVLYRFDSPEVAAALSSKEKAPETKDLVQRHAKQDRHLVSLAEEYGAGEWTKEEYIRMRDAAQDKLSEIKEELAKIQSNKALAGISIGTLREAWETASIEWKRNVISLIVEKVLIMPGNPGNNMWRGWKFEPNSVKIVWRQLAQPAS